MVNNSHPFSKGRNGFQVSSLLQDLIVYGAQLDVYERSNEVLSKYLGVKVSTMQVHKIANFYGLYSNLKDELLAPVLTINKKEQEVVYAEVDGSMLYTREDGWKEVKVGRVFTSSDCVSPQGKTSYIKHSHYYGSISDSKEFTSKMEALLDSYKVKNEKLVFITDGAVWIKNWIEDAFPEAIAILDFFHAVEHLSQFAQTVFDNKVEQHQWIVKQKELLLESKVEEVIKNIQLINTGKEKEKQALILYYQSNTNRMDYKKYKTIGASIIGSGAIESAHRTLIQKRLKLSGQRWTIKGAQNMINLRTIRLNNQWNKIIDLTKKNVRIAA